MASNYVYGGDEKGEVIPDSFNVTPNLSVQEELWLWCMAPEETKELLRSIREAHALLCDLHEQFYFPWYSYIPFMGDRYWQAYRSLYNATKYLYNLRLEILVEVMTRTSNIYPN